MPNNKNALDGYVLAHFGQLVTTLGQLETALEHARDFLDRAGSDADRIASDYEALATATDESRLTIIKAIRTLEEGTKSFSRSVATR